MAPPASSRSGIPGDSGDGGKATNASIAKAINIALDKSGNIYMARVLSPQPPGTGAAKIAVREDQPPTSWGVCLVGGNKPLNSASPAFLR
jgi:hypothetical protein